LLFCVSSLFLGGADGVFGGISGGGIDRAHQFGGKSWWIFRADADGEVGEPDAFVYGRALVPGGESLSVGDSDAGGGSGAAPVAPADGGRRELGLQVLTSARRCLNPRFSMNFGLRNGSGAFEEIEVAAFVSLLDVLQEEFSVAAWIDAFLGAPGCAASS
jgi:hypothetical protein